MIEYCDGCGRRNTMAEYCDGCDNDLLLCLKCFLGIYKQAIGDLIGVVVVIDRRGLMPDVSMSLSDL